MSQDNAPLPVADLVAQAENTETLVDYRQASAALTRAQEALERAADRRCISLARLHQNGRTYRQLATDTGLSFQRVAGMVQRGRQLLGLSRTVRARSAPKPAATRFEHDELVEF